MGAFPLAQYLWVMISPGGEGNLLGWERGFFLFPAKGGEFSVQDAAAIFGEVVESVNKDFWFEIIRYLLAGCCCR